MRVADGHRSGSSQVARQTSQRSGPFDEPLDRIASLVPGYCVLSRGGALDLEPVEYPAEAPAVIGYILVDTRLVKRVAVQQLSARIQIRHVQ